MHPAFLTTLVVLVFLMIPNFPKPIASSEGGETNTNGFTLYENIKYMKTRMKF